MPPGMSTKFDFPHLLKAIQRRWLIASVAGIVAAVVVTTTVWFLMPQKFVATAWLHIDPVTPSIAYTVNKEADANTYQKTQVALVKYRPNLVAALRPQEVAELKIIRGESDPVDWLEKELTVDFNLSPEIMRLQIQGENPKEMVTILDSVVNVYLEEVKVNDRNSRREKGDVLQKLASVWDDRLRLRRRALKDLAETVGSNNVFVVALNQQFQAALLADKERELIGLERELRHMHLEAIDEDAKIKTRNTKPDEAVVNRLLVQDLGVRRIDANIDAEMEKLEKLKAKMGEDSPFVKSIADKVKNLQASRLQLIEKKRPALEKDVVYDMLAQSKEKVKTLGDKIVLSELMQKELKDDVVRLRNEMHSVQSGAVDLEGAKEESDRTEGISRKLHEILAQMEVEANAPLRVYVLAKPDSKRAQTVQKQVLIAGGSGITAMLLVIVLIAYWELCARRIISGEDVVSGLGWRLIGSVPALPDRARRGFVRSGGDDKYWHSLLTESVDATRTMLLHAARTEGLRSVMVTSAVAGEGKTSLSCHLATSLARAGRKTILIDCDLRSPAAHQLFELPVEPGICELLRKDVELADTIRPTPAANLWIIPSGRVNAQTLQELAQEGIAPILEQLKKQFEFLVIDSSPVLPVVDSLVIGQQVDVVIFSLLRSISRIPNVYAAYQRLSTLGVRMLGAVVNGVHKDSYGYSYRYYARQSGE